MVAFGLTSKPEVLAISLTAENNSLFLYGSSICAFENLGVYLDTKFVLLFWESKALGRCLVSAIIEKTGVSRFLDLGAICVLVNEYFIVDVWVFSCHNSV